VICVDFLSNDLAYSREKRATTLNITTLSITRIKSDTQHNDTQHDGTRYMSAILRSVVHAEFRYTECRGARDRAVIEKKRSLIRLPNQLSNGGIHLGINNLVSNDMKWDKE
jgi:hypothetical protein